MSENKTEQLALFELPEKTALIDRKLIAFGASTGGFLGGAIAGAAVANYAIPQEIEFANGVKGDVSATVINNGLDVVLPIAEVVASKADLHTPIVSGAYVNFTELHGNFGDKKAQAEYVALISNFHDSVIRPTSDELVKHIAIGAGLGAATATAMTYAGIRYIRHLRKQDAQVAKDIKNKENKKTDDDDRSADEQATRHHQNKLIRRGVAALASLALIGGGALTTKSAIEIETASSAKGVPVLPRLAQEIPSISQDVEGIKIIGGGDQVNAVIYGILDQKRNAEKPWEKAYQNLVPVWQNYAETIGSQYLNNPDYTLLMHSTDPHCNLANIPNFYNPALKLVGPDVVDFTGDEQTNSGTMFYEKDCIPSLVRASEEAGMVNHKTIDTIIDGGNHDNTASLDDQPHLYNLDKDHVVKIGNLVFVGRKDPRSTVWNTQKPGEDELLVAQGKQIAKDACAQDQDNNAIVVNSHDIRAGKESTALGCADLVLNGHTHNEQPFKTYLGDNGNLVTQHTGGSESGAGSGFSLFDGLQKDAFTSGIFYSKSQNRFVHAFTIKVDKDNSDVSITSQDLPAPLQPQSEVDATKNYSATTQKP